jgi:integrase
MNTERKDVYSRITSQIVASLEQGVRPWIRPWNAEHAAGRITRPLRHNGQPYSGINVLALWASALVPTGLELGLGRIGFHTFRHTYRAWLDETGAPVGVQQKLMRHAHVSTTMDQYGNASALAKRKANRPIVQRLLRRSATQQVAIQ